MKSRVERIFDLVTEPVRTVASPYIEIMCNKCFDVFKQSRNQTVLGFLYTTCKMCRKGHENN